MRPSLPELLPRFRGEGIRLKTQQPPRYGLRVHNPTGAQGRATPPTLRQEKKRNDKLPHNLVTSYRRCIQQREPSLVHLGHRSTDTSLHRDSLGHCGPWIWSLQTMGGARVLVLRHNSPAQVVAGWERYPSGAQCD